MEASSGQHDATTGFHDIKAVPAIARDDGGNLLYFVAGFSLAAVLAMLLLRFVMRGKKDGAALESPRERFYKKLRFVRAGLPADDSASRRLALELSEGARAFLEGVLPLPATELTPAELRSRLPEALRFALPALSPVALEEMNQRVFCLLKSLERMTFGTDVIIRDSGAALPELCGESEKIVGLLDASLSKEAERRASGRPIEVSAEVPDAL